MFQHPPLLATLCATDLNPHRESSIVPAPAQSCTGYLRGTRPRWVGSIDSRAESTQFPVWAQPTVQTNSPSSGFSISFTSRIWTPLATSSPMSLGTSSGPESSCS
jgi:hypothetical protein